MATQERTHVGEELITSLVAQDWDRLERCLDPSVRFFAAVPSENPLRVRVGAGDTAKQLAQWFGGEPLELLESRVEPVADKLHLSYRLRTRRDGALQQVEQQAYCKVEDDRITQMHLACAGFSAVSDS